MKFTLALFLMLSVPVYAAEIESLSVQNRESRMELSVGASFLTFTSDLGGGVAGPAFNVELGYGLMDQLLVGIGLGHSFDAGNGFADMFTRISLKTEFALFGTVVMREKRVMMNSFASIDSRTPQRNSLRLQGFAAEYLIHGTSKVYSAFGVGVGLAYDYYLGPDDGRLDRKFIRLAGRFDLAGNVTNSFTTMEGQLCLGFRL